MKFPVSIFFTVLLSYQLQAQSGTVTDIDGNVYHVIKIGKQNWFQENLKTSRFRDGSAITKTDDDSAWANTFRTHTPMWCYYRNEEANNTLLGKLYNWYVVSDTRQVCPAGWHVPSEADFKTLADFLGGDSVAGDHLRSNALWKPSRAIAADNSSGFTALPAEFRDSFGDFLSKSTGSKSYANLDAGGFYSFFWSVTDAEGFDAMFFGIYFNARDVYYDYAYHKSDGFSVRCLGD